jgi:hypothetical protein
MNLNGMQILFINQNTRNLILRLLSFNSRNAKKMSTESKYYSRDIFHFEEYVAKIDKSRFDFRFFHSFVSCLGFK